MREAFRAWKRRRRLSRAEAELEARRRAPPVGRAHRLPFPLVVSLTSHPPRFGALARALDGLLLQTVRPDATILWLAPGEAEALPAELRGRRGLTVAECPDWRSYKKLVPALLAHPEAGIATADDDLVVPATWVEELEAGALDGPGDVVARRAHRMRVSRPGQAAPYEEWDKNIPGPERGPRVVGTGGTGMLIPPGRLHPDAARAELFQALAPSSDDLWLWWMLRLGGGVARKVGGPVRILEWEGTQGANLRGGNLGAGAGNDRAVAALAARYGLPAGDGDIR